MKSANGVFQNILCATDFSESAAAAFDAAAALAHRCQAKLTVAHVVRDVPTSFAMLDYGTGWEPMADDFSRLQQELRDDAQQSLERLASERASEGMAIATEVFVGLPYASIIEAVEQKHFDLVVVGTRGMSAIKRVLIGSTATRLARACPVPVWVAREGAFAKGQSVLVPLDFSAIGHRVLSVAASLAAALDARLHLLHVYDSADFYGVPPVSEDTRAELAYYRRRARRAALWKLEQTLETLGIDRNTATLHVAQGVAHQVINSTARRLDAGLIVMGSVGRRGLSALLIGNTAEKLLHTSDRSLLVIKPELVGGELIPVGAGTGTEEVATAAGRAW
jgi:nucleotide-binding universal stress UspA family protein